MVSEIVKDSSNLIKNMVLEGGIWTNKVIKDLQK